jgi:hypothetical protein
VLLGLAKLLIRLIFDGVEASCYAAIYTKGRSGITDAYRGKDWLVKRGCGQVSFVPSHVANESRYGKSGAQYGISLLMRVAQGDKSVIKACLNEYASFIWALAQKMTDSSEEAEAATEEIFMDLWRYAKRAEKPRFDDGAIVNLIARQKLKTYANQIE